MDGDACPTEEPSLRNVVEKDSLRWIFVGGKGGVGKTTCSCSLAVLLSKCRESVLILSTDPAHNVSDAFNQKFTKKPTLVKGFSNLYAMEVDPSGGLDELPDDLNDSGEDFLSLGRRIAQEMLSSLPGIDEAVSFAEVMKLVNSMNFSVVVFDTAPTGHTLRLLSFPSIMEKGLERILRIKNQLSSFIHQISSLMGGGQQWNSELFSSKLDETLEIIKTVNKQFTDRERTTFVCVCIPEFLSLFETERLIQELTQLRIDVHNIVVNLILPDVNDTSQCAYCESRKTMQRKYLTQIDDLYCDFNITKLELQEREVRGVDKIMAFSKMLVEAK